MLHPQYIICILGGVCSTGTWSIFLLIMLTYMSFFVITSCVLTSKKRRGTDGLRWTKFMLDSVLASRSISSHNGRGHSFCWNWNFGDQYFLIISFKKCNHPRLAINISCCHVGVAIQSGDCRQAIMSIRMIGVHSCWWMVYSRTLSKLSADLSTLHSWIFITDKSASCEHIYQSKLLRNKNSLKVDWWIMRCVLEQDLRNVHRDYMSRNTRNSQRQVFDE